MPFLTDRDRLNIAMNSIELFTLLLAWYASKHDQRAADLLGGVRQHAGPLGKAFLEVIEDLNEKFPDPTMVVMTAVERILSTVRPLVEDDGNPSEGVN